MNGHLGWNNNFAIVSSNTMNLGVQASLLCADFDCIQYPGVQ